MAFEPFRLERETKPDGRSILFYSWPDEPPLPHGMGTEDDADDPVPDREAAPDAVPWSPETQPTDRAGSDV